MLKYYLQRLQKELRYCVAAAALLHTAELAAHSGCPFICLHALQVGAVVDAIAVCCGAVHLV